VEVISGVARCRRWPKSEKARIVAESYAPGASATAVAVGHGLHRNQIFAWRRQPRNRAALIGHVVPGHCHGSGVSANGGRLPCRASGLPGFPQRKWGAGGSPSNAETLVTFVTLASIQLAL